MKKAQYTLLGLFLFIVVGCTSQKPFSEMEEFLTGTWKTPNTESYEVWQKESETRYIGYAYKIKDGEKKIWERMVVSKESGDWQFAARVPDQNEGEAIVFKLVSDPSVSGEWLFVNEQHDFPKRILYKRISGTEWFADVRGDEGKGFSVQLIKHEY